MKTADARRPAQPHALVWILAIALAAALLALFASGAACRRFVPDWNEPRAVTSATDSNPSATPP